MVDETLIELANKFSENREEILSVILGSDTISLPEEFVKDEVEIKPTHCNDMYTIIGRMSIPEKIKLALFGNKTARMILIRDVSSKQLPMFVLQNPRITEGEICDIAKNTNVEDFVLRTIANSSQYMKSYATKLAIVSNPKVPIDISLKWIKFVAEKDLKRLSTSKNIPQVLSTHCRKLLEQKRKE